MKLREPFLAAVAREEDARESAVAGTPAVLDLAHEPLDDAIRRNPASFSAFRRRHAVAQSRGRSQAGRSSSPARLDRAPDALDRLFELREVGVVVRGKIVLRIRDSGRGIAPRGPRNAG